MRQELGTKDKEEERRKRIFASDSSHWYHHDASPCHQVKKTKKRIGDPDEYRPANLTDARKLKLLPSVTNLIGKYSNKAGIEIWKRAILLDQITAEIAYELYEVEDADKRDEILKKIAALADAETNKYAELGSLVHTCLEKGVQMIIAGRDLGEILNMCNEVCRDTGYEESAARIATHINVLQEKRFVFKGCTVIQEKGFAFNVGLGDGLEFGLAGKVDLLIEYTAQNVFDGWIPTVAEFSRFRTLARERAEKGLPTRLLLDFKTRKPNRLKGGAINFPSYSSDVAQLAGYSEGAKYAAGFRPDACFNILIASDAIRDLNLQSCMDFREHSQTDLFRGMDIIKSMASMWVAEERLNSADPYIPQLKDEI